MPTRAEVTSWKPEKLSEWAAEMEADTKHYEGQLGRILTHFSGTTWSGAAYDAASDRFTEEDAQGRRLSAEITDVVSALRAADVRLANEKRILLGKVNAAENDASCPIPLKVGDNWVVSSARTSGETLTGEVRQTVIDIVNAHQAAINTAYYSLTAAASEVSLAISTASQEIRVRGDLLGDGIDAATDAPSNAADLGTEDGQALADYMDTHPESARDPEVLDRIASQLPTQMLTSEQLRILSEGGEVDSLPAEVQDYYRSFFETAGDDGVLALSEHLETREESGDTVAASQRDALANGLMVISNEDIGTGRNPDGTLTNPGSYENIPSGIRALLEAKETDPNPIDSDSMGPYVNLMDQWKDTHDLGDLMGQANPGYEPGTELGTKMILKSSDMISSPYDPDAQGGGGYNEAAAQFLDIGARNDDSSHQIWSGEGMPEDYKPRETVQSLLYYDWPDSAQGSPTVLLDRVSEEAQLPAGTERGDRGREDLAALGQMFGSTDDDAAWENTRQEFASNPELSNKISQMVSSNLESVSSPHLSEGVSESTVLNDVARWSGVEGNRLLELGSYTEEGRVGLTAAVEQYRLTELTEAMQNNPENPGSVLAGGNAGTLSGRLDSAMWNAIIGEDTQRGQAEIEAEEQNLLRRAKLMGADMAGMLVDEGVAKIPGSQVVQDVTGLEAGNTTSELIQELIGKPEYDFKERPESQELRTEANQNAYRTVLNAANAAGQLPEDLKTDGRPATVEEIIDRGGEEALTNFLSERGLDSYVDGYRQSYSISVGEFDGEAKDGK